MIKQRNGCEFQPNVKEHATPLAGASIETGLEVHVTSDVADRAASGGCVSRLVLLLDFVVSVRSKSSDRPNVIG